MKHTAIQSLVVSSALALGLLVASSGCRGREIPLLPDRIIDQIIEGQTDPHEYQELLATNTNRVSLIMQDGLYRGLNVKPLPLLCALSFDWGNYTDSVYFAKLSLTRNGFDQGSVGAYIMNRYLEGGTDVHRELESLFPKENIFWFRDFEPLLGLRTTEVEFRTRFRKLLLEAGNTGPDLLVAFVSHQRFEPDLKTLLYLEAEACWFFDYLSDLRCADVDEGRVNQSLTKDVHNTKGRYFFFSLFSREVSRHWEKLDEPDSVTLWAKRAATSYEAAKIANDWEIAWEAHALKRRLKKDDPKS